MNMVTHDSWVVERFETLKLADQAAKSHGLAAMEFRISVFVKNVVSS